MHSILDKISKLSLDQSKITKFEVGNIIKINYRIVEGEKERIQPFIGVVISFHRGFNNISATFTVRKEDRGFAVERKFALYSPKIESITILKRGVVRRAKLYYLKKLTGKAARLREKKFVK